MATLNFTLGENIGQLLHSMSWENLMDFQPEKAVNLWVESFHGMPEKLAKQAVIGNYICTLDPNDNGGVLMNEKADIKQEDLKGYPSFDKKDIWNKILRTVNIGTELDWIYARNNFDNIRYKVMCWIDFNKTITIEREAEGTFGPAFSEEMFPIRVLLNSYFDNGNQLPDNFDIDECSDRSQDILKPTIAFIEFCENLSNNFIKIKNTIDFVIDAYGLDGDEKFDWTHLLSGIELMNEDAQYWLDYVKELCANSPKGWTDESNDRIQKFLDDEKKNQDILGDFGPMDPEERWNAGFIAPDGSFYGLVGETANLLHINLANAIVELNGWEEEAAKENFGKDWFILGKKGFIKLTNDHVYYEGYDEILGKKPFPPTYAQMETLKKYGKRYQNMFFGPKNIPFQVEKFAEMDEYHQSLILRNDL